MDLIEAGLNDAAGDLRSSLWGLFDADRIGSDFSERPRDRHERARVIIGGDIDMFGCRAHRSDEGSRDKISLRAPCRSIVAVELHGTVVEMVIDLRS